MAGQIVQKSHSAEPGFFYGYIVVVAAFCVIVVTYGTRLVFGVFFKPMLTEFGWTSAMTAGAFSLSMILYGLLSIVMGGLNDRFGPRIVLILGGFLLGIGYLLMSQVSAVWQLYLFYGVIIGIGMGGVRIPLLSTVSRWFVKRRSMATGIVLTGTGIGTLIAAPMASRLISIYDWRTSYIILGSVVLVAVVIAAQFLRRDPGQMGQVPYGEKKGEEQRLRLGTDGFVLSEAVYSRQFWMFIAICVCHGFLIYAVIVHIVPHTIEMGISAASAANTLAVFGGANIVGMLILGSVAERIGVRKVYIIGFILMSAALFWVLPSRELWMLYLFAIVIGFADGGMAAVWSPLVAGLFGLRSHGLILGVFAFGFTIGGAIGAFLVGYIFDFTGSYQLAFLLCAALGIAGLVLIALLKPTGGKREQNEAHSGI